MSLRKLPTLIMLPTVRTTVPNPPPGPKGRLVAFSALSVSTLRIFVADDHEMIRRVIAALLAPHLGWEICGEAGTGRERWRKWRASSLTSY